MKRYLIAVGIWLALTLTSALIGFLIINPTADYRLAERGVRTEGQVIAKEQENHEIVRYTYVVAGKSYTGAGHGGGANPSFANIQVGQALVLVYDPSHPQSSTLGYPAHHLKVNLAGVVFVAIVLPLAVIISLFRLRFFRFGS